MKSNHKTPLISLPQPNRHNMVNLQKNSEERTQKTKKPAGHDQELKLPSNHQI
jgi:hypothetical protein